MGFAAMEDRMVWPPSLSRDRKWPCLTKCTHSRVVCLRLEGNIVHHKYGSNEKMGTIVTIVGPKPDQHLSLEPPLLLWERTSFQTYQVGGDLLWVRHWSEMCRINRSRDVTAVARPTPLSRRRPCILASPWTSYAHPTNDVCSFPRRPSNKDEAEWCRLVAAVSGVLPAT